VLNGKALYLPQPEYPVAAKAAGTTGTVVVRVTIDEQGNVISATAVSGPPALQQVSVTAAALAKFSPTLLVGEPVQVVGIITYSFAR
jgi:protein TonB